MRSANFYVSRAPEYVLLDAPSSAEHKYKLRRNPIFEPLRPPSRHLLPIVICLKLLHLSMVNI